MMNSGNMLYRIEYSSSVLKRDIRKLSSTVLLQIKKVIEEKSGTAPTIYGKPLRHNWRGHHRLRIGNYRIIYRIDEPAKTIYIVAIKHRKAIYE